MSPRKQLAALKKLQRDEGKKLVLQREYVQSHIPLFHHRLMEVGLYATGHIMHEVVRKAGWEWAYLLKKHEKAFAQRDKQIKALEKELA